MSSLAYYQSRYHHPELDTQEWVSLNNAGLHPISLDATNELKTWADRFYKEGFLTDHDYSEAVEFTRTQLAILVGCQKSEVAFFASTAGGINQIAWQLPLGPEDQVLVLAQDYPSLIYPFEQASLKRGFQIKKIPNQNASLSFDVNDILCHFTSATKLVAISWYQYQTGATCELKLLLKKAKERGIFVLIDVMQGLGIDEFIFWKMGLVDAVAGGSHKWLSSPVGVGFLAIQENWIKAMSPHNIGSLTFGTCDDVAQLNCFIKSDATRFEPASKAAAEIAALGRSVALILKTDPLVIRTEAIRLALKLEEGLKNQDYQVQIPNKKRSHSIINFSCPKSDLIGLSARLKRHRILHAVRNGGVRLSPSAINSDSEIDYVLSCLKS